MNNFVTGQHLLAFKEIKRYVLRNNFSNELHLVTEDMLKEAFGLKYYNIISNRNDAWYVEDYND